MRQFEAAKALLDSIRNYDTAVEGDSDDAEIDAAIEMKEAALEYLRLSAGRDVLLADLVDEYEHEHEDEAP